MFEITLGIVLAVGLLLTIFLVTRHREKAKKAPAVVQLIQRIAVTTDLRKRAILTGRLDKLKGDK